MKKVWVKAHTKYIWGQYHKGAYTKVHVKGHYRKVR